MENKIYFIYYLIAEWLNKKEKTEWDELPLSEKMLIYKYLTLLKRWEKDPSKVSRVHQKWILENCNCKTWLVPSEILEEKRLWL